MKATIDPGHGGADPGAYVNNTNESALNLRQSLLWAAYLQDGRGRNRIDLTRYHDDTLIRAQRAPKIRESADVFVCIHHNAFWTESAHGFETFILRDPLPTDIILQRQIHSAMEPVLERWRVRDRGPKRRNFWVLTEKTCPGLFVEVGFMTNPHDYDVIIDRLFQAEFAQAGTAVLRAMFP